jgi:ribose/xylose/arabinose/galactoside ABC-type transport system permease subunit
MLSRLSPSLRHRIWFLLAGNLALMGFIYADTLSNENASFVDELARCGPNAAPRVLAGLGLAGIVFTGAIDLSVGAIIVVAGTVFGILYDRGASPGVCFAGCCATAWALSVTNGYAIRLLKIPAIIVTLAGLTFYRGLAMAMADWLIPEFSGQVNIPQPEFHLPAKEYATPILLAVLVAALLWEQFGRQPRLWLAHGSSPEACRLKGLQPAVIVQSSFFVGGLFLSLAALLEVTNRLTIEPARMVRGFELDVIGGVVLGGTNIFGGEGSYLGTALGAFFLYWVGQTLVYAGISEYWRVAVSGAVILTVIGFDCALHRKRKLLEELR